MSIYFRSKEVVVVVVVMQSKVFILHSVQYVFSFVCLCRLKSIRGKRTFDRTKYYYYSSNRLFLTHWLVQVYGGWEGAGSVSHFLISLITHVLFAVIVNVNKIVNN